MKSANMTRKELKQIQKSMKDPEFQNLLGDYMLEVSEPSNVLEQNEYLRQLEKENQLPKGLQLLELTRGFVIESTLASSKDNKFSQKLFINVCGNQKIEKTDMELVEGKSKWKVPYHCGKPRLSQLQQKNNSSQIKIEEQDSKINKTSKKNNTEIVSVIEVAFHSETISMCSIYEPFKKMVCDISIEAVGRVLTQKDQIVSADYRLDNCLQVSKWPLSLMSVHLPDKNKSQTKIQQQSEKEEPSNLRNKPQVYYDIMEQKEKHQKEKLSKQNNKNIETQVQMDKLKEKDEDFKVEEEQEPKLEMKGPIKPEYKVIHGYNVGRKKNLTWELEGIQKVDQIHVDVWLPKVKNIADVICGIENQSVKLEYLDIYSLEFELQARVDPESQKGRFDKKKKKLRMTFDVIEKPKSMKEIESNNNLNQERIIKNEDNKKITEKKENDLENHPSNNQMNNKQNNILLKEKHSQKLKDLEQEEQIQIIKIFSINNLEDQTWILFQILGLRKSELIIRFHDQSILIEHKSHYALINFKEDLSTENLKIEVNKNFMTLKINKIVQKECIIQNEKLSRDKIELFKNSSEIFDFEKVKEELNLNQKNKTKESECNEKIIEDTDDSENETENKNKIIKSSQTGKPKENLLFLDFESTDLVLEIF